MNGEVLNSIINRLQAAFYFSTHGLGEGEAGDSAGDSGDASGDSVPVSVVPPPQAASVAVKPKTKSKPIAFLFIVLPLMNCDQ